MTRISAALGLWLLPSVAWGQAQVVFDLDDQAAQDLGLDTTQLEDELGALIADQLNLSDPEAFVAQMAQANAMAQKGMGVDYATNIETFIIGGSLGSAVGGVGPSFVRGDDLLPDGGYAFHASVMGGVNLGILTPGEDKDALDRIRLYVSGMGFQPPGGRQFRGSMVNFGAHAQLKVIGPANAKIVEWGGLDLTSGYEFTSYSLGLESPSLPIAQDIGPAQVTWTATGTYDVSAAAQSIPVEVSTNLRIFVASVYLGGAYDLNFTQWASTETGLSGPIDAAVANETATLGTASITYGADDVGLENVVRLFGGVQANITVVKVYGHLNVGLNDTFGGHFGIRFGM